MTVSIVDGFEFITVNQTEQTFRFFLQKCRYPLLTAASVVKSCHGVRFRQIKKPVLPAFFLVDDLHTIHNPQKFSILIGIRLDKSFSAPAEYTAYKFMCQSIGPRHAFFQGGKIRKCQHAFLIFIRAE